jgi:hypothetical protein
MPSENQSANLAKPAPSSDAEVLAGLVQAHFERIRDKIRAHVAGISQAIQAGQASQRPTTAKGPSGPVLESAGVNGPVVADFENQGAYEPRLGTVHGIANPWTSGRTASARRSSGSAGSAIPRPRFAPVGHRAFGSILASNVNTPDGVEGTGYASASGGEAVFTTVSDASAGKVGTSFKPKGKALQIPVPTEES